MATEILLAPNADLPESVTALRGDPTKTAGSLVRLDFSRAESMAEGVPVNFASDTALALCGDTLAPVIIGNPANILFRDNMLGFGARTRLKLPPALAAYWVGRRIAVSCAFRLAPTAVTPKPWRAGAALAQGDILWAPPITSGSSFTRSIYTVTAAGTAGGSPPVHSSGSEANGSATLRAGVRYAGANDYGQIWPGPILFTDSDDVFPSEGQLISVVDLNGFVAPPLNVQYGALASVRFNHVTFDPTINWVNGVKGNPISGDTGATIGAGGSRSVVFGPEVFGRAELFNAVDDGVPLNPNGFHIGLTRLAIEDLDAAGLTLDQFTQRERDYLLAYHPDRLLFAADV